jgi:DNA-damage-inducible protein J
MGHSQTDLSDLKSSAEAFFQNFGLDLPGGINALLDLTSGQVGYSADRTPNAETLEAIEEVERMVSDPSLGKSYTDVREMMKELLA